MKSAWPPPPALPSVRGVPVARALGIYLVAVFAGAALIAPHLWSLVQSLAAGSPAWEGLARQPFHRYVNRCLLVLALGGLWPLVKALRLGSWQAAGFSGRNHLGRELRAGLLAGWLSLFLVAVVAVAAGARVVNPDPTLARWLGRIGGALATAAVVSVLEESLFRGAVFSALRRAGGFASAAGISSGIYALVHFFARPAPPPAVDWLTGFATLGAMLRGFLHFRELVPGLLNLALAGWMLAWARERTGRLWMSIGLHAGWIFWLKLYGFGTREVPGSQPWLWGGGKLIDGWVALAVLASVAVLLPRLIPRPTPASPAA